LSDGAGDGGAGEGAVIDDGAEVSELAQFHSASIGKSYGNDQINVFQRRGWAARCCGEATFALGRGMVAGDGFHWSDAISARLRSIWG
jgi:hypothetical protein